MIPGLYDYWIEHAIDVIQSDYGVTVSVDKKRKDLLKFGRNNAVQTTKSTIMELPSGVQNEVYVSSNSITTISSSSGSDTGSLYVEGHTIDGSGNFTFVAQTKTLTGQTQATLDTPLARCTRIYNNGSVDFVGNIYVYETDTATAGVPDTAAKVHCIISAGNQQSFKASTTLSNVDYWIITNFGASVIEKTASYADFTLEVRNKGKVFRPTITLTAEAGVEADHDFIPYRVVPANSDIRVTAIASGANIDCSAYIQGVLATVASKSS